ncbi:hypothetical protein RRV45_16915 [Bacillus sp. DTU_2020_1000418_1_SI_GHA_SEK_038]|uniref:hypothetical protein n=1 Tax=Bacillus sp. DTU_2020_1000418_1_SI_GHA_SEK_038 TaxID=3077585 RepID=UPI0028EAA1B7|nr:hypothetical protein [Bacillus sp. DTU_2020_1000418_1_SI_GHA_SEK_038]WNS74577.1 hypothetical protein RRV45_16915 [Bacillus sp. DTU_2020_1000418_1_SI_GHA_SEK_038]
MKKNRYLLCLLLCGFFLYFALPRLNIFSDGLEGIFAITWLAFALIVVAGNLTALLYSPKKAVSRSSIQVEERKRSRAYHR